MGLHLPTGLVLAMGLVGYTWPAADETKLLEAGRMWIGFADTLYEQAQNANDHVQRVVTRNSGQDITAMWDRWTSAEGPTAQSNDAITATRLIGAACLAGAAIVAAFKIGIITALARLAVRVAQAIAAAGASLGTSLATLPLSIAATRVAIRGLLHTTLHRLKRIVGSLLERARALFQKITPMGLRMRLARRPDPLRAAADRTVNVKAITPSPVWRTDRLILRRADDRHPDEVFGPGFHPRNPRNADLESHLRFEESAFVSTTRLDNPMDIFPTRYLYDVDAPGGIDIVDTMGSALRTGHQREVAFPGGIEGRFIKGARPYDATTGTFGGYVPNPGYRP
ncbi:hypothetical protein [Microtetraspora sp. NBRC 16547]|uniref:scabin-related ADP-ribosyltransferase n=1 Tax=Microtetraspora sp. NBRC 16547 TaxID=3030993 RepID=UPI0024A05CD5|nr:hypothetical protein [Microtetraspora sp. NBRC 16547]GLW96156.1 hypothetical protein Misp02_02430 [Microtetraspora sp. NBRC 16547]